MWLDIEGYNLNIMELKCSKLLGDTRYGRRHVIKKTHVGIFNYNLMDSVSSLQRHNNFKGLAS